MKTAIRNGGALAAALVLAGAILSPATAAADGTALVTNGNDSGKGSLRDALERQQASHVFIAPSVTTVTIESPLTYSARAALTLEGSGQTVRTGRNVTLLAVTEGADLTVSDLAFEGRGDYSIKNRGDIDGEAGKGIFVDVRDDQTGMVSVELDRVSVAGVAGHGVHISDCSLADDCGAGSGGGGQGSDASVSLTLNGVRVDHVGYGGFDADGVRVDDRGPGGIYLFVDDSSFTNIGADGLELDEGDSGDVYAEVNASEFRDNGGYCDPGLLAGHLPEPAEREFNEADGATVGDDVPPVVTGTLDDSCFEREVSTYASGSVAAYEFGIDLDDGIDFDEAGEGSLTATMNGSIVRGNLDEGVDFDEGGDGDARVRFIATDASGNHDDGFKLSEEDAGGVTGMLDRVRAVGNGGKGVVLEEESAGGLFATVSHATTAGNDDGEDTGIEVVQEDDGAGSLRVRRSTIAEGITREGVEAD
ncbi:hypothetical protein ACEZHJ_06855 [Arhodomonas sp. KWT2]|uniref:hypothetical protein n=3 Tax=unclassified Arhodomonas TaxID=2621637 RepID=UPI0035BF4F05